MKSRDLCPNNFFNAGPVEFDAILLFNEDLMSDNCPKDTVSDSPCVASISSTTLAET